MGEGSGLDLGFRIKRRRFIIEPLRDDSGIEVAVVKPAEVPTPLPLKKKVEKVEDDGVIMNSKVRFVSEEPTVVVKKKVAVPSGNKPVSISAMLHKSPELYEF